MRLPNVLGHRGWSQAYPENTRRAFARAFDIGADGIEFDVQLSLDGAVVVMHDPLLERTTDGQGPVATKTWAELRQYNAAVLWPGTAFEPIPSLQEVLEDGDAEAASIYNVELKTAGNNWRSLIEQAVAIVKAHPLRHAVRYSSFDHPALAYLKTLDPKANTGLLMATLPSNWLELIQAHGANAVHLHHAQIDAALVERCRQHGIWVAAWTVDEPDDIDRMMACGVDAIITNRVDLALGLRQARARQG